MYTHGRRVIADPSTIYGDSIRLADGDGRRDSGLSTTETNRPQGAARARNIDPSGLITALQLRVSNKPQEPNTSTGLYLFRCMLNIDVCEQTHQ